MSELNVGLNTVPAERNMSAVTAASSNYIGAAHAGRVYANQASGQPYQKAVVGGGGLNIYDRLMNDSMENLLRPTAQMIGSAQRVTGVSKSSHPRQLASASFRKPKRSVGNSRMFSNAYRTNESKGTADLTRAFSSQAYRTNVSGVAQNSAAPHRMNFPPMYTNTNSNMLGGRVKPGTAIQYNQPGKKRRNLSSNVYRGAVNKMKSTNVYSGAYMPSNDGMGPASSGGAPSNINEQLLAAPSGISSNFTTSGYFSKGMSARPITTTQHPTQRHVDEAGSIQPMEAQAPQMLPQQFASAPCATMEVVQNAQTTN